MRYYIYVSDAKVDMIFDQIDRAHKTKITRDVKVDLKGLGVSAAKETESQATRMSKLDVVSEYVSRHCDVGSIDSGSSYVRETATVRWGPVSKWRREDADVNLVYFGGQTTRSIFGLTGSNKHLIGGDPSSSVGSRDIAASLLPEIIRTLGVVLEEPIPKVYASAYPQQLRSRLLWPVDQGYVVPPPITDDKRYALHLTRAATEYMEGAQQRVTFLAKTLVTGENPEPQVRYAWPDIKERVWLGTPIWVALAE